MVDPSGIISLPMSYLRTMISESSNFQTWVEAEDATEALASIYITGVAEGSYTRPFALIAQGDNWNASAIASGAAEQFIHSGSLQVLFEENVAEANQAGYENASLAFLNTVGAIIADLETASGSGDNLIITRIDQMERPSRAKSELSDTEGDYYQILFNIEWGVSGA